MDNESGGSRRTIHIGNLNYDTSEETLEKYFSNFGKIQNVYIVGGNGRSRGYGFIEYEKEDDAREAISKSNRSMLEGNELSVDFSQKGSIIKRMDGDNPPRRFPPRRGFRGRFRGRGRGFRGRGRGFRGRSRGFRGRSRGFRGRSRGFRGRSRGFRGRSRGFRGRFRGRGGFRGRGRGFRREGYGRTRSESPPLNQEKTAATLFVANLPYDIDDEGLAKLFAKFSEFKTAHVVRSFRGRPRGYGFVEFTTEEAQLQALKEMDGQAVGGTNGERKLIVKIATRRGGDDY